jgi:hypothetical protein
LHDHVVDHALIDLALKQAGHHGLFDQGTLTIELLPP